jgi:adenylate cyclase class 2
VQRPDQVRDQLRQRADEQVSTYRDPYVDRPDGTLTVEGCELRVRVIETEHDTRAILTYKVASRSSARTDRSTGP